MTAEAYGPEPRIVKERSAPAPSPAEREKTPYLAKNVPHDAPPSHGAVRRPPSSLFPL